MKVEKNVQDRRMKVDQDIEFERSDVFGKQQIFEIG